MIGILGGGQLGCMLAESLTEPFMFFDPDPLCPAVSRGYEVVSAPWSDLQAIDAFVMKCRRLTYEFENIPVNTITALAPFSSICIPSLDILRIFQNRKLEKKFILENGFPAVPHEYLSCQNELDNVTYADWIIAIPEEFRCMRTAARYFTPNSADAQRQVTQPRVFPPVSTMPRKSETGSRATNRSSSTCRA